ncbi:MAG: hypothetical protein GOVbin1807_124 [Prokaryotic dsDNA virus sp.]|nr:MAG: hypothetical protein GOVbin1807_124 [Prokaryotic dsDNA virus sp.]|tara:strand:+ start:5062 stop:5766 length:705 start_codon:yes stop_codon:yes gene_type:complete
MSNDMQTIMESWRRANALNEQQELEKFLESLDQLDEGVLGDVKGLFGTIGQLIKRKDKIPSFVAHIHDKIIMPSIEKIEKVLNLIEVSFKSKTDQDSSNLLTIAKKIGEAVDKTYNFLKNIPRGSWKKATAAIGIAVALKYMAFSTLIEIPIEEGAKQILLFFKEEIVGFAQDFLGEALVEALSAAWTGGLQTFVSYLSKIAKGVSFVAQTLAPAVEPFLAGDITLTRFEEELN